MLGLPMAPEDDDEMPAAAGSVLAILSLPLPLLLLLLSAGASWLNQKTGTILLYRSTHYSSMVNTQLSYD